MYTSRVEIYANRVGWILFGVFFLIGLVQYGNLTFVMKSALVAGGIMVTQFLIRWKPLPWSKTASGLLAAVGFCVMFYASIKGLPGANVSLLIIALGTACASFLVTYAAGRYRHVGPPY